MNNFKKAFIAALVSILFATSQAYAAEVKNIVIVHGAFADGSGWQAVNSILEKDGYMVTVVQEPITSLADDVAATKRVLEMQDRPVLLVGHSYGGIVITEAGNDPKVLGLVYVAAFQPDHGESLFTLAGSKPAAGKGVKPTQDGQFLYIEPTNFAATFAGDLPKDQANVLAHTQVFAAKAAFAAKVGDPSWRSKKSWAIVATEDQTINPDLERDMAKRAGSMTTEIQGSHAIFLSQPAKVAAVIEQAARDLGN